ncbi:MAG: glycosyltransferase [Lachnospiraceae bacterium]|nr:glycosyltransferase [Lachnospiraceae bacterium]
MKPKVSVIIPVYKTEKYIDECLASVLGQDYDNLEIILVDDGSPDRCPEICDRYAEEYANIRVIHKKNSGLGLSRNAGVDASEGEYVTFVDSDDKLDGPEAVSAMVKASLDNNADLVVGCFRRFNEKGKSEINSHHLETGEDIFDPDFRFRGFYQYGHLAYDWGKLCRKEFLREKGLKRGSYPFAQDKAFNMRFYANAPRYAFIGESVYCYRINEDSVTFRYKDNYIQVCTSIAAGFDKYCKKKGIKEDYGDLSTLHIYFGSFFLAKQELEAGKGLFGTARKIKEFADVPYVRKSMKKIISRGYCKGIKTVRWRWMIWCSTILFDLHMYLLFTLGIALLRKIGVDGMITKRRYNKEKNKA